MIENDTSGETLDFTFIPSKLLVCIAQNSFHELNCRIFGLLSGFPSPSQIATLVTAGSMLVI